MITIQEHQKIDTEQLSGIDIEALRSRINYDTSCFIDAKLNLIRYEFNPAEKRDGFYSYFRIGAEWLDQAQSRSIVVTPKMQHIDFIKMFMTCLHSSETADNFSSIYHIDFDAKPIRSKALSSLLSPLLIIQFLMSVKRISTRGLRKGYVSRSENLGKVKGRVDIRRNERLNMITGHRERLFCHYEEYSIDTPENRFLKKALQVAYDMVSLMCDHEAYATLSAMCNHCLSAFSGVSDDCDGHLPIIKVNKLYQEYTEALRFAHMILRRQDIAINKLNEYDSAVVPVFRIDMALLFEHYVLALMRDTFGVDSVKYQVKGYRGRFIADLLISQGDFRVIVDAKYIDGTSAVVAKGNYVMQLSGYARDKVLLQALGIDCSDVEKIPIIPCLLFYPTETEYKLSIETLFHHCINSTVKFYTCPITIPKLLD